MKKRLSFMMTVAVIFTLALSVYASGVNNGGFENPLGDPAEKGNARSNDGVTRLEIVTEAHAGQGALMVTGRQNEYGAVAFDVTDYILENGSGEYYATAFVKGFSGKGRITLHTKYDSGINIYRQTGILHDFNARTWTKFGVEPSDANVEIPMKSELDWDSNLDIDGLESAVLYFWIEGDNTADLYIDDINLYKKGSQPTVWKADEKPKEEAANAGTANPKTGDGTLIFAVLAAAGSSLTMLKLAGRKKGR